MKQVFYEITHLYINYIKKSVVCVCVSPIIIDPAPFDCVLRRVLLLYILDYKQKRQI
jgi:hypothetical protein